jgi:hypothetical protein
MENTRKKKEKNEKPILRKKKKKWETLKKSKNEKNKWDKEKSKELAHVEMKRKWEMKEIIYLLSCRKNPKKIYAIYKTNSKMSFYWKPKKNPEMQTLKILSIENLGKRSVKKKVSNFMSSLIFINGP